MLLDDCAESQQQKLELIAGEVERGILALKKGISDFLFLLVAF